MTTALEIVRLAAEKNGVDLHAVSPAEAEQAGTRRVRLRRASTFTPRPVRWCWVERLPRGELSLLAGREGIGKSTVAYTLAAQLTRGTLPGDCHGVPRAVFVAATEDSWEHTIVPRLMAADADLERVFCVDVTTSEDVDTGLSLPRDLIGLERAMAEHQAALLLLDPLMSRLSATLDTHKDADVRLGLEPVVNIAQRTSAAVLGIIHVNRSGGTDPLNTVMASRAFTAVARAVLFVMLDPDDENVRLLGVPKSNLGRIDLPTLAFTITGSKVADTHEGEVWSSRVQWLADRTQSIREVLESSVETSEARSATGEAAAWLLDYLTSKGGADESATVKAQGARAGHSLSTLKAASRRLKVQSRAEGFPRRTWWSLSGTQSDTPLGQSDSPVGHRPGETCPTGLTEPTQSVGPVGHVGQDPPRATDRLRCAGEDNA